VNDNELLGYAWSENLGWISLNCQNDNSCGTSNFGVRNNSEGNLSGYAWGENIGWINFAPTNGGVHIDSSGDFSGYAWGENIGWVVFSCDDLNSCGTSDFRVETDWRPASWREDEENDEFKLGDVEYSSTNASITIKWKTNQEADSHIRYGKDENLEEEENEDRKEKSHQIILKNLDSDTGYYFRIKSTNGNDYSETSKIYSVSTKPASRFFASRPYLESQKPPEKVKIEVSDATEETEEAIREEQAVEIAKTEEPKVEEAKTEKTDYFAWVGSLGSAISEFYSGIYNQAKKIAFGIKDRVLSIEVAKNKEIVKIEEPKVEKTKTKTEEVNHFAWVGSLKSGISGFFSGIYDQTKKIASGTRDMLLSIQKKAQRFAGSYKSNKEIEIRKKQEDGKIVKEKVARFFATQVYKKDDVKKIAEVRFQLLNKKDIPIPNIEATLASDPQTSTTDENGIVSFKDVPVGIHTLAFADEGEEFRKKIAISDTLTEEGKVMAEVIQVKAEKEKIALWMWAVILLSILAASAAVYFAKGYYKLKNLKLTK
jgi:hypothetical protein